MCFFFVYCEVGTVVLLHIKLVILHGSNALRHKMIESAAVVW